MSTVMKNTTDTAIMTTMNIADVGIKKKKIAVCVDTTITDMTTMSMNITSISMMNIVLVGTTMKKKIVVCAGTTITNMISIITNMTTMSTALAGMNTTTTMNMIIMDTAITSIPTMNIALVGTITMGIIMMDIISMNIAVVGTTTMSTTDTIIQAAAANIITAPQKRW